ncbi:hypothetical protein [Mycobacteroides abscessus]|uniref:hypothetical protein n=1 Tax=Mycobacteroides abscessus TaxID=36809 RepID=UPI0009A78666|nr:hypothetical protein [Mycobacteroides abscessus]SLH40926.1 Uncharacterised protein [Mycobacteroides abscessus subsp. massiliense]
MTGELTVNNASTPEVETPSERATRRAALLRSAVTSVWEILADIYRDNDWENLANAAGHTYPNFLAFIQDRLGGSASNARRYRQGVIDLIVPLQELTGTQTSIPITPIDIVRLGRSGARAVVERAPKALAAQDDHVTRLRQLIDTVIDERTPSANVNALETTAAKEPIGPTLAPTELKKPLGKLVPSALPEIISADAATDQPLPVEAGTTTSAAAAAGEEELAQSGPDAGFRAALETLLTTDPLTLAQHTQSVALADDCLAAARQLARISQLLR